MPNVLRMSEASSLALHAMALMASKPAAIFSTGKMAKKLKVSEAHLSKVLQRLGRNGLVKSNRGPRGGFSLGKPPGKISLRDVYEAIDGPLEEYNCLFGTPVCSGETCVLGECLENVYETVRKYLEHTDLSSLKKVYHEELPDA